MKIRKLASLVDKILYPDIVYIRDKSKEEGKLKLNPLAWGLLSVAPPYFASTFLSLYSVEGAIALGAYTLARGLRWVFAMYEIPKECYDRYRKEHKERLAKRFEYFKSYSER